MAGISHVTPLEAEAYGTGQTVLLYSLCCYGLSDLMYQPCQLPWQSFSYKWGAAGWGGESICLCLTGVLS
jgi:hypothetical protein